MAMSTQPTETSNEEIKVGVKLRGDLGDIQITDENIESEEDDISVGSYSSVQQQNALSTLPQDLVRPSVVPVFGSVQVTESENVHFGNNTYFNGPVTIKQIVHTKAHDNPGYEHTEEDPHDKPRPEQDHNKKQDTYVKAYQVQFWLKLTFSAVCIIVVAIVCAVVSLVLIHSTSEESSTTSNEENYMSTRCLKVEGKFYSYQNVFIIITSMGVVLLITPWCYDLLTKASWGRDDSSIPDPDKQNAKNTPDKYNVEADPLLIAPTHLRIVSRTEWLAQPAVKPLDKMILPAPWVIIAHTATESCYTQSECVYNVRLFQSYHVESRGWSDIGYNYLVGGDGSAYFGRGWEYQGAHTLGYNKYSIGIAFIGTFNDQSPPQKQIDACKKLIKRGVELGKIAKDYKLLAHRQLAPFNSPGDKLFELLKEWPHFVKNLTDIKEILPDY